MGQEGEELETRGEGECRKRGQMGRGNLIRGVTSRWVARGRRGQGSWRQARGEENTPRKRTIVRKRVKEGETDNEEKVCEAEPLSRDFNIWERKGSQVM